MPFITHKFLSGAKENMVRFALLYFHFRFGYTSLKVNLCTELWVGRGGKAPAKRRHSL